MSLASLGNLFTYYRLQFGLECSLEILTEALCSPCSTDADTCNATAWLNGQSTAAYARIPKTDVAKPCEPDCCEFKTRIQPNEIVSTRWAHAAGDANGGILPLI